MIKEIKVYNCRFIKSVDFAGKEFYIPVFYLSFITEDGYEGPPIWTGNFLSNYCREEGDKKKGFRYLKYYSLELALDSVWRLKQIADERGTILRFKEAYEPGKRYSPESTEDLLDMDEFWLYMEDCYNNALTAEEYQIYGMPINLVVEECKGEKKDYSFKLAVENRPDKKVSAIPYLWDREFENEEESRIVMDIGFLDTTPFRKVIRGAEKRDKGCYVIQTYESSGERFFLSGIRYKKGEKDIYLCHYFQTATKFLQEEDAIEVAMILLEINDTESFEVQWVEEKNLYELYPLSVHIPRLSKPAV